MTPQRRQRLILSCLLVAAVGGAVALALTALERNINLFFSPSQVRAGEAPAGRAFRIGGMVVDGSVARGDDLAVTFALTDTAATVLVAYTGILPDLFREGQGIVALGAMRGQVFVATQVLAKHDETYMPPEVTSALQAAHRGRYGDAAGDGYGDGAPAGDGYGDGAGDSYDSGDSPPQ
ncbi:MAG: cytochrome c maturation protein CcmE [Gammaproteobacteria bacterium]|nr:cytochrome c maturation protein CcmE [Gammaproteobacteria bacterium]